MSRAATSAVYTVRLRRFRRTVFFYPAALLMSGAIRHPYALIVHIRAHIGVARIAAKSMRSSRIAT